MALAIDRDALIDLEAGGSLVEPPEHEAAVGTAEGAAALEMALGVNDCGVPLEGSLLCGPRGQDTLRH